MRVFATFCMWLGLPVYLATVAANGDTPVSTTLWYVVPLFLLALTGWILWRTKIAKKTGFLLQLVFGRFSGLLLGALLATNAVLVAISGEFSAVGLASLTVASAFFAALSVRRVLRQPRRLREIIRATSQSPRLRRIDFTGKRLRHQVAALTLSMVFVLIVFRPLFGPEFGIITAAMIVLAGFAVSAVIARKARAKATA